MTSSKTPDKSLLDDFMKASEGITLDFSALPELKAVDKRHEEMANARIKELNDLKAGIPINATEWIQLGFIECGWIYHEKQKKLEAVKYAASNLRVAQRAYMNDRGNDALGKAVGKMAEALDEALGKVEDEL